LNLQIQRTLVFETSAIPGYATSAEGTGTGRRSDQMELVFATFVHIRVLHRPRRQADGTVELGAAARVEDLLAAVGANADSTLVVRGSTPLTEDEPLADGEEILLLSAFSGG
jgi:sulfur carrier protein ThiS